MLRSNLRRPNILRANVIAALSLAAGLVAAASPCGAQGRPGEPLSPELQQFRDIYKELVEINTTDSTGDTVRSAEAMAARQNCGRWMCRCER